MPAFSSETRTKIDALRALHAAGTTIEVYEMVRIDWPSPTDPIYYAVMQVDEVASVAPPVGPIETRLIPDGLAGDWFLPAQVDSTIGDEEIDLKLWDADGVMSDLITLYGEGIRVELFYWFAQVALLLPQWHGHLRLEDEAEVDRLMLKAVQGFRSAESDVPRRAHYTSCQAVFGGVFNTQAEIDEHADCPYNRHIAGGTVGNLNGGVPYTSCPRLTQADCIARLGNNGNFMLSHRTVQSIVVNNQTSGPRLFSTSQGNETNLKEPVRVVMGVRRVFDMKVMAFRKDFNNNNPDHGWYDALYEGCEGPIENFISPIITVGGVHQNAAPLHYGYRLGTIGQSPTSPALTSHSYSGTAHFRYNFGWVNPSEIDTNEASASVIITGLNDIRIYTDVDSYTPGWTNNRAWQLMRMLADKRWGFGYDYGRMAIEESWIGLAAWAATNVRYTDAFGNNWDHVRAMSDVDLLAKKIQQQVDDLCLAGRFSRPFLFDGKIHVVPLRKLSSTELAACPVFTDEGSNRNIIWDGERTTLKVSRKSDLDLPNRVEVVYDDYLNDHLETPAPPVEDVDQQLRAGRVVGDKARKINTKKYKLLGVVTQAHAMKCAWGLLDLGEMDEGGLQNNLRLIFSIWFADAIDLHPYKVIRVNSSRLTRYGFTYFRVMKMRKTAALTYEVEVQAYNEIYMNTFETDFADIINPPPPPPGGGGGPIDPPILDPPVCRLEFGTITQADGVLNIPILPC